MKKALGDVFKAASSVAAGLFTLSNPMAAIVIAITCIAAVLFAIYFVRLVLLKPEVTDRLIRIIVALKDDSTANS